MVFALIAILLKSNLDISLETEKDLGKSYGNTANSFAGLLIVPFVLWIYLKDLLFYSLEKPKSRYHQYQKNRTIEGGDEELMIYNSKKRVFPYTSRFVGFY